MSTPLARRAFAVLSSIVGTAAVVTLILVMNAGELRQDDDEGQAVASFTVEQPKKKPPKKEARKRAKPKKRKLCTKCARSASASRLRTWCRT